MRIVSRQLATSLLIFCLSLSLATGPFACSSTRKSTTTVTKEISPSSSVDQEGQEPRKVIVEERTEVVEEDNSASCGGILSCTVEGVGFVIALPFRLVGFVVDVIF